MAIGSRRLRPGDAHWDQELPVEVRLCPLRSKAGKEGGGGRGGREEEGEDTSDKILRPSPGRWAKMSEDMPDTTVSSRSQWKYGKQVGLYDRILVTVGITRIHYI